MVKVIAIRGTFKGFRGLQKGFASLGDTYQLLNQDDPKVLDADIYLQTNLIKPKFIANEPHNGYQFILDSGKPFIVTESASFRKFLEWRRIGWYSYKWTEGIFGNENCPRDRWNKFEKETKIKFKDWHSPGDNILIMGQKLGDSSLNRLHDQGKTFFDWLSDIVGQIRQHTDRPIVIRPHPRGMNAGLKVAGRISTMYDNITISKNTTQGGAQGGDGLQKDLESAYCVVTYNSLSAIESVCEGIPTFAMEDGSMIWPIAHKDISKIEKLDYNVDITQWQNDIAYTQWSSKEQRYGHTWSHLKELVKI